MTVREQMREPIFQITNLRRAIWEVYSTLALGFLLGLLVGAMLWAG